MRASKAYLGDVAKFIRGVTFKPTDLVPLHENKAVVCMRTKNVQKNLDESDLIAIPQKLVKREEQFIKEGDILVSTANSWELVGKCCWIPNLDYIATAGGFISILRGSEKEIWPRYLYYWLDSGKIQFSLRHCGRQTTNISNLAFDRALNLEIPVPLLEDQKRIVTILDKSDAIRRKRRQAIQLADEFLRSVFLDMFGDPATNPKGWQRKKIRQLGKVVTGNTPSRQILENYGEHIEWIKSDNINTPSHILTKAEEALSEAGEKLGRTVPANSTLVTCIAGTPECIGNAALADRKVAFNQQINAIVPFDNVDPYFLYMLVIISKKIIQRASTNSMKGMVSKGTFQEIELISPPYNLQKKFGSHFYAYLNYLDKQELQLKESDNLFNSLCQKAFRGEL